MHFDLISFIIGLIIAGLIARFFTWSENLSLAHRIAYNLMLDAQKIIKDKLSKLNTGNLQLDFDDSKIYPIEDENFLIQKVPALRKQSDVHIEEYLAVYSKLYDLWFLIEDNYNCETLRTRYSFYLSDSNFEKRALIKIPYDFDLTRYLKEF